MLCFRLLVFVGGGDGRGDMSTFITASKSALDGNGHLELR